MQVVTLYKYNREDGGVTISPIKPETIAYTEKVRLIADVDKVLTNGVTVVECVDVDSVDGWTEIDTPTDDNEQYAEAGRIMLGVSE